MIIQNSEFRIQNYAAWRPEFKRLRAREILRLRCAPLRMTTWAGRMDPSERCRKVL